ncbi:SCO family protein [Nocardioides halotolerans]|uniref:SCO family protein n=1 Tax=Nocardioides halotolerans TaxID=433660 RepID=UPI0003F984B0|nr:SCO family protein [Nocardioides halotolerans]
MADEARAPRRPLAVLALALALVVALAGCGGSDVEAGDLTGKVLDPPFTVAGDALVDTDGQPYSLTDDTEKRLTLVFFGYTHCPDICSTVMTTIASALTRLDDRDRDQVDVVFVTTDPERDTPDVLRRWLDHIDKDFVGVTGPIDEIAAVGRSIAVGMGDPLPSGGYDVDAHTTQVTGIDSADEAPIYWSQTTSSKQFADDIHILLGDS